MKTHPMPTIDQIMECASRELAATHYLECERLCVEALTMAREAGDFDRYARILLPLQEARRQRRQIAADAGVVVLAGHSRLTPAEILDAHRTGCLMMVAPPYQPDDARAVREEATRLGLYVEPLVVAGPSLRAMFEQEMEREGDAALAKIPANLPPERMVDELAHVLAHVGDHEIAHQRLAAAARAAAFGRANRSAPR